jgi:hypothetical protein
MKELPLRTFPLSGILCCSLMTSAQTLTTDREAFGRMHDARGEAMGRANAALAGDTRNMFYNPAALAEFEGVEVYAHEASPWYLMDRSTFQHVALACRLADRFSAGFSYDRAEIGSGLLGGYIDPNRGFIYQTNDILKGGERVSVLLSYRIAKDFSVGAAFISQPLNDDGIEHPQGQFGVLKTFRLAKDSTREHSIRVGGSLRNFAFTEQHFSYSVQGQEVSYTVPLPVQASVGVSWRKELRLGWSIKDLPSLTLVAQVQADDDLTQRYRSAMRFGGEVVLLDMLALRAGWYSESVDDQGQPSYNKDHLSELTYGLGINLPLDGLTGHKWPLVIALDYCSLPQASYSMSDLNPFTDQRWDNFQSVGVRINYRMSPLLRKSMGKG